MRRDVSGPPPDGRRVFGPKIAAERTREEGARPARGRPGRREAGDRGADAGIGEARRCSVAPPAGTLHRRVMRSFFPLRRGEGATLVFLVAFAAFAFVPAWRTIELGGMAVFGWLIAALMLLSPALALVTFLWRGGGGGDGGEG